MAGDAFVPSVSRAAWWSGWVLGVLPALLLLFSAGMKLARPPFLAEGFEQLGYRPELALGLGIVELACTLLYLLPQTAVLGAILLTGYLGGAVATHVRVGDPYFMPIVLGALLWGGLYLRDPRLRALVPWRR
jgi:hypothetical protein